MTKQAILHLQETCSVELHFVAIVNITTAAQVHACGYLCAEPDTYSVELYLYMALDVANVPKKRFYNSGCESCQILKLGMNVPKGHSYVMVQ